MITHVKKALVALVAITVAVALSGCLKMTMELNVNPGDTVNGSVIVGFSKDLVDTYGADTTQTEGIFPTQPGVTVKPYDDGKFVGTEYSFANVPLKVFNEGNSSTGSVQIVRKGDQLITTGQLDFSGGDSSGMDMSMFMDAMDISVAITYPGKIVETTGEVKGQTVTWTPKYGEVTQISATVDAPLTAPVPWLMIIIIVVVVLIVAAAIVLLLLLRKKKTKTSTAA